MPADRPDLAARRGRGWPASRSSPASPGTVGGALRGNAGGRQGAIGQFVRRATVLDPANEIQVRERDDLSFADRESNLDEPVILSAEFELEPEDPESVVRRMRRIWIIKKENQPYGHQSSGCIFKNPSPDVSAGALIDQAGLKGTRFGGAEVSDRHANFIVAHPGAKASDVLHLIDQIQPAGLAAIRLRVGTPDPDLVSSWSHRDRPSTRRTAGRLVMSLRRLSLPHVLSLRWRRPA